MKKEMLQCVVGPLDGTWWPNNTLPAVPIRRPTPSVGCCDDPELSAPSEIVRYKKVGVMHNAKRQHLDVFAPDDWTVEQVCARLMEVAPDGF